MHTLFWTSIVILGYLSIRKDDMNKNTNTIHDQKHLTLTDRTYIEQELSIGSSFKSIAAVLHKDPTTISKEVRRNAKEVRGRRSASSCWKCKHFHSCNIRGNEPPAKDCRRSSYCTNICKRCYRECAPYTCSLYIPFKCERMKKAPYICNSCDEEKLCPLNHRLYHATLAQRQYEKTLVKSRVGINLTPEELQALNELISPLVMKGQPLSHIFAVHEDEIPVCRRTLYNYFDQRVFQVRNIDLPRRVRYKKRKQSRTPRSKNLKQVYRNKRTYVDFERFIQAHPNIDVVEMDTVKGGRASGKCLLTLLFRSCSFMLVILLPQCTQACVIKAINDLTEVLGLRLFRKYFPVILTDNGSEFKNPYDIEKTEDGKHRTYVFYCDPYVSNQKARLEKNHEYIRYVIPKGKSMYKYTQEDINLMASHINSTARDSLNGVCPFDLANLLLDKKIPALTGLHKVSPDSVMLKPALIEHRSDSNKEVFHE